MFTLSGVRNWVPSADRRDLHVFGDVERIKSLTAKWIEQHGPRDDQDRPVIHVRLQHAHNSRWAGKGVVIQLLSFSLDVFPWGERLLAFLVDCGFDTFNRDTYAYRFNEGEYVGEEVLESLRHLPALARDPEYDLEWHPKAASLL